ncbi:MAG TPA: energy transducer TonB [Pyrinomonadaceae bacterium]|nr:energy transducer TonB [Pyrinomonadaceae bacterium]
MKYPAMLLTASALALCVAADARAQSGRRGSTDAETLRVLRTPEPAAQDDPQPPRPEDGPTSLCVDKKRASETDALMQAARAEHIFASRQVDTRPTIKTKPNPGYTEEARRNGTRGMVRLRVVLSATGRVTLVTVLKHLPDGLTQKAIDAACEIKFTPAVKDGQPVAQQVVVEYNFWVDQRGGGPIQFPRSPRWPK